MSKTTAGRDELATAALLTCPAKLATRNGRFTSHEILDDPTYTYCYWGDQRTDYWPDVSGFVDSLWESEEREQAVVHLRHGVLVRAYMGFSLCRMCGCRNGSTELTDGTYIWPEGLAHYVEEHDVRLPEVFVAHIQQLHVDFDEAEIDEGW